MSKITLDYSGSKGLVERHQGDLTATSSTPNLRYIGEQGQISDGIYMPFKKYGYMSPAVNAFTTLTGTVASAINSIQYDSDQDKVYLSEEGVNILQLDGLDDTSVANWTTITTGHSILDMERYEVNDTPAMIWVQNPDNGVGFTQSGTSDSIYGGMSLGFKTINSEEGLEQLSFRVGAANNGIGQDAVGIDDGTNLSVKLAQSFHTTDFAQVSNTNLVTDDITGVHMRLQRQLGTGVGITMKVSIQGSASANVAPYTSQGAWADATAYSLDDTVTYNSQTWQCISAHTSTLADDRPGTGSSWATKWNEFGAPDESDIVSGTFTLDSIPGLDNTGEIVGPSGLESLVNERVKIEFTSKAELDDDSIYWLVLEEVGSNMTATDSVAWLSTINNNPVTTVTDTPLGGMAKYHYPSVAYQNNNNNDSETAHEQRDVLFILNESESWTKRLTSGQFGQDSNTDSFLFLSDNALLYWIVGNKVHAVDGSSVGGVTGTSYKNVLSFPSYTSVVDIAETRSKIYIGVQSSSETTLTSQDKYFTSSIAGMFIWDRKSLVVGSSDFFKMPGAKEIKSVFTSASGNVLALTVGNSGQTEIRGINGNEFGVFHTFEIDGWPASRRGVSVINDMTCWLGANGIFYAYGAIAPGEKEYLHKIGDMSGEAAASLVSGPILVGNENSSLPLTSILYGWSDLSPTQKVQKWYPYGQGTINSVAQTSLNGNVYSKVDYLPLLSTLRTLTMYCIPVGTEDGSTIATVKLYKNQSTTAFSTKTITNTEAAKGYVTFHLDEHNVNSLQTEIEHAANTITGTDEFEPSIGILEYDPTGTSSPDNG